MSDVLQGRLKGPPHRYCWKRYGLVFKCLHCVPALRDAKGVWGSNKTVTHVNLASRCTDRWHVVRSVSDASWILSTKVQLYFLWHSLLVCLLLCCFKDLLVNWNWSLTFKKKTHFLVFLGNFCIFEKKMLVFSNFFSLA